MRRRAGGIVVAGAAALVALFAWPAGAQSPPVGPPTVPPSPTPAAAIGTLSGSNPPLHFSGAVGNPTPLPLVDSPVPPVCVAPCKEFTFVNASSGTFLVALQNTVTGPGGTFNADDGFDLYVYDPSGSLVAAGNGIGANGQSVEVSSPVPGTYTIVVTVTYAEDTDAAYTGEVRLESGSTWAPPAPSCNTTVGSTTGCFELPVLQAVPAYDLAVSGLPPVASTPLGFPFPVNAPTSNSCYADETFGLDNPSPSGVENPTTRCLRFTSDVRNTGAGALEVQIPWLTSSGSGVPQSGFAPGECQTQQVVFTTSGAPVTRSGGGCEFHPEHGHFHYKNLISFTLYNVAADGGVGTAVGSGLKESFCLSDDDYFGYGTTGPNGSRQFVGQPGCNVPSDIGIPAGTGGSSGSGGAYVVEGISPGWGDVYTWDTPDQYIDISHVAPGIYDLVEETNPANALLVAGPTQTCALTQLQLTATSVKTLSTDPNITCPS
ncbi:MAG TPA: hypothetical protein VNF71_13260 [Acidimicrobiales bacterium]|nr:hypothetical protein [Acidimicrobiales bacterium]